MVNNWTVAPFSWSVKVLWGILHLHVLNYTRANLFNCPQKRLDGLPCGLHINYAAEELPISDGILITAGWRKINHEALAHDRMRHLLGDLAVGFAALGLI